LVRAGRCTPEHLAAVTGFDVEVVKRLLRRPRQEFSGRHPTDRVAVSLCRVMVDEVRLRAHARPIDESA
jgi:hypothetical protein